MIYTANFNNRNHTFDNLDDLINTFFGVQPNKHALVKSKISIPVTAFANDNELAICYEMAGVNVDDIKISVDKNELSVTAEKQLPNTEKVQVLRNEINYGNMSRVLTIGSEYDLDSLEARLENGTLYVKIQRKAESKPKTFHINTTTKKLKE